MVSGDRAFTIPKFPTYNSDAIALTVNLQIAVSWNLDRQKPDRVFADGENVCAANIALRLTNA